MLEERGIRVCEDLHGVVYLPDEGYSDLYAKELLNRGYSQRVKRGISSLSDQTSLQEYYLQVFLPLTPPTFRRQLEEEIRTLNQWVPPAPKLEMEEQLRIDYEMYFAHFHVDPKEVNNLRQICEAGIPLTVVTSIPLRDEALVKSRLEQDGVWKYLDKERPLMQRPSTLIPGLEFKDSTYAALAVKENLLGRESDLRTAAYISGRAGILEMRVTATEEDARKQPHLRQFRVPRRLGERVTFNRENGPVFDNLNLPINQNNGFFLANSLTRPYIFNSLLLRLGIPRL